MSFDISDYKLKHIIKVKDDLLNRRRVLIPIGENIYEFRIEEIKSEFIEIIKYFEYLEVTLSYGPLEAELNGFTNGKTRNQLTDNEVYAIRFSKFKMEVGKKDYEFEISGVGPRALKVSLYVKYRDIEEAENLIESQLKDIILDEYTPLFKDKRYQEKLIEIKKESDQQEAEQARIKDEVRREQEEKERKWRELEARLNSNKPTGPQVKRY
ncbi:hypothetical protein [Methanobrevibacter sp.]|uniref:hypothetical protein n=1 Tax=Methanobrevibacter sp. TaxID=66852 RepID=UPI003866EEA2